MTYQRKGFMMYEQERRRNTVTATKSDSKKHSSALQKSNLVEADIKVFLL